MKRRPLIPPIQQISGLTLTLALILILLSSCTQVAPSALNTSNSTGTGNNNNGTNPTTSTAPGNVSDLTGTWNGACDGTGSYHATYSGSTLTSVGQYFSDSKCTTPTYSLTTNITYTGGYAASSPTGAKTIDLTYVSILYTPVSSSWVTQLNNLAYCGVKNWALNQSVNITGMTCVNGSSTVHEPNAGQTVYSIYAVYNNQLYLGVNNGAGADGSTSGARQNKFSSTVYSH